MDDTGGCPVCLFYEYFQLLSNIDTQKTTQFGKYLKLYEKNLWAGRDIFISQKTINYFNKHFATEQTQHLCKLEEPIAQLTQTNLLAHIRLHNKSLKHQNLNTFYLLGHTLTNAIENLNSLTEDQDSDEEVDPEELRNKVKLVELLVNSQKKVADTLKGFFK